MTQTQSDSRTAKPAMSAGQAIGQAVGQAQSVLSGVRAAMAGGRARPGERS